MARTSKCPICHKLPEDKYNPFCSKRCADVDLGKWLGGLYAIPVIEEDLLEEDSKIEDGADEDI